MGCKMSDEYIIAPGVTRLDCDWGHCLKGRQEAIIKAGLAMPDWFADGSTRNERGQVVRSKSFEFNGRRVDTTTRQKSHVVDVWLSHAANVRPALRLVVSNPERSAA